jgi:hypothetical protein
MSAIRSEKVDTRALLNGEPGDANFTHPRVRLAEREKVLAYWPDKIIRPIKQGFVTAPPWRLLLDPLAWHDVEPAQVHEYVYRQTLKGTWPSLDGLRRRFGRVSNHRGPDENPEQESLL